MHLSEYDFTVSSVNNVVERPYTYNWHTSSSICHKNYVMAISLDGEAVYNIKGVGAMSTKSDDIYIFPPGNERTGHSNPEKPWHFISINFDLEFHKGDQNYFNETLFQTSDIDEKVRRMCIEVSTIWTQMHSLYRTRCRAIVQQILCQLIVAHTRAERSVHEKQLHEAKKYMREHFTEQLDIAEIAKLSSLSSSHFRKLFCAAYSVSPMQYIVSLRINKAHDLLSSGEFNVSEAAFLSGFSDVFYFSRLFKKKTGISPSEVRRASE